MPRRTLSRILPSHANISGRWFLRPFRAVLHDPALWATHRRNVLRALAVGLMVCFIPFPIHTALAATLAVLFRMNLPVAIVATMVSNPLTMGPMFYGAYRVGLLILGQERVARPVSFSMDGMMANLAEVWAPLLLGCAICGASIAAVSYLVLNQVWIASARRRFRSRGRQRRAT
jgi:uncharacterized protein (DUF2062 family)